MQFEIVIEKGFLFPKLCIECCINFNVFSIIQITIKVLDKYSLRENTFGAIHALLWSQIEPEKLQDALWDTMPLGESLDELVEDWCSHLSKAINGITPPPPYPWYTLELWRMKQQLRWLE